MVRGAMAWLVPVALGAGVACERGDDVAAAGGASSMGAALEQDLKAVQGGRILFTHHSVGVNILAGVDALSREAGVPLLVLSVEEGAAAAGPAIVHGGGGRNTDPRSKIDHFAALIRSTPSLRPDLAFMKLCYVDFAPDTDVPALFAHYHQTLEALKRERPEIRFAHVTTPLFRRPTDLRSTVKRLLGRSVWEDAANARRAEYNALLRERFGADPVFDLAGVESTGPDGAPCRTEVEGRPVQSLDPRYTDDGGHLNAAGQRAVGAAAIRFVAAALRPREGSR
jgi:hypothetical protein